MSLFITINGAVYTEAQLLAALLCSAGVYEAYAMTNEANGGGSRSIEWSALDGASELAAEALPEEQRQAINDRCRRENGVQAEPKPKTRRTIWSCPMCKSFSVHQDANYNLNEDSYSIYDKKSCGDCSYDGHSFNSHEVPTDFDHETDQLPG